MFDEEGESWAVQVIEACIERRGEYREWNSFDARGTVDYMDIDNALGVGNVQRWGELSGGRHCRIEK